MLTFFDEEWPILEDFYGKKLLIIGLANLLRQKELGKEFTSNLPKVI